MIEEERKKKKERVNNVSFIFQLVFGFKPIEAREKKSKENFSYIYHFHLDKVKRNWKNKFKTFNLIFQHG